MINFRKVIPRTILCSILSCTPFQEKSLENIVADQNVAMESAQKFIAEKEPENIDFLLLAELYTALLYYDAAELILEVGYDKGKISDENYKAFLRAISHQKRNKKQTEEIERQALEEEKKTLKDILISVSVTESYQTFLDLANNFCFHEKIIGHDEYDILIYRLTKASYKRKIGKDDALLDLGTQLLIYAPPYLLDIAAYDLEEYINSQNGMLNNKVTLALFYLTKAYDRLEQYDAMLRSLERERIVLESGYDYSHPIGPETRLVYNLLETAEHYLQRGEKEKAVPYLKQISERAKSGITHLLIGDAFLELGLFDDARMEARKALESGGYEDLSYLTLAYIERQEKGPKTTEQISFFNKVLDLGEDSTKALAHAGLCNHYVAVGDNEKAIEHKNALDSIKVLTPDQIWNYKPFKIYKCSVN